MKSSLEIELEKISTQIGYPIEKLPKIGEHNEEAIPYLLVFEYDNLVHYIVNERGQEYERKIFTSLDSILYHVFCNITFEIATEYELENRIDDQYSRIVIFEKQTELMSLINEKWGGRIEKDIEKRSTRKLF